MNTKLPYEILLRGNPDGTFSGGHVIMVAGGDAKAIGTDAHPWPEVLGQINSGLADRASKADEIQNNLDAALVENDRLNAELANVHPEFKRIALQKRKDVALAEAAKIDAAIADIPVVS